MAGYTRQSVADIINGLDITAPPLNAEFNQLASAFDALNGHSHDGTPANGPRINLATSVQGYLQPLNGGSGGRNNMLATSAPSAASDSAQGYAPGSLWLNTTTNRVYFCTRATVGSAQWPELARIGTENVFFPATNDTVDLGSALNRFKNLWLAGNLVAATAGISGELTVTGAANLNGPVRAPMGVTGNITGNLTGNVTAATGTSTLNNLVVNGTVDVTNTVIQNVATPTMASHAATKGYVDQALADLLSSGPGELDTLAELAAALGNDPNFAATVNANIATKLPLAGGTMSGTIAMANHAITGLPNPVNSSDAVRLAYVTTLFGSTSAAAISATTAARWANADENTIVESGAYSAKHHAIKAAASAASVLASEQAAASSRNNAATSATNAAASASAANNSAGSASASATSAAASRDSASGSATSAQTSANTATSRATAAATSATNALASENAANAARAITEAARDQTLAAFDSFDDRYLGALANNPTTDNDGNALQSGALYFNTTLGGMMVWASGQWVAAYVNGGTYAALAQNLNDLPNKATARANLGLTSAATTSVTTTQTDDTAGRLTKVGDFGIGAVAPPLYSNISVTDNSIAPGLYGYGVPNGSSGGPAGVNWATLLHMRRAGGGGETQTIFADSGNDGMYQRHRGTGAWSDWARVYTTATLSPIQTTGIQTITGQTTVATTAGPQLIVQRTNNTVNATIQYTTTGGNVAAGQGRAGTFSIGNNADLTSATNRAFEVDATSGNFNWKGVATGDGGGLSNVPAASLTGTIPNANLSGNYTGLGDISMNRLRILVENDASEASTAHGIQIGPSTGTNLIIDNNEIMTRVNGVGASTFFEYGIHTSNSGDGFKGKGTLLENLNASNVTLGTLPDARLSSAVAMRNRAEEFAGSVTAASSFYAKGSGTTHYWMSDADNGARAVIYKGVSNHSLVFRSYQADGAAYKEAILNGSTGDFTVSGRFIQTGTNAWGTGAAGGLQITGTTPNIWFNQTDNAMSGMIGVNGTSFFVLNDRNSSGAYDQIMFQVDLLSGSAYLAGRQILTVDSTVRVGNGLTGTGNINAPDEGSSTGAITLGTPGSITPTSTNSVTANSHTHFISEGTVRTLIADGQAGTLGTYALALFVDNSTNRVSGFTTAGSNLRYANAGGGQTGTLPNGTWRLMGHVGTANATHHTSLWLRIA